MALGILTLPRISLFYSPRVNCRMWSTVQNISQSSKRCFPHDFWSCPWEKYSKPLYVFLPSSFNRKYVHKVACTVVFVGPVHFVFTAYPGDNATCPLSNCSNKNDGPRVRFNCISTVSCKGSVCVAVLTSFYGRFFVEEGQFIKYTPSTLAAIFFIYWPRLALARWIFRKSTSLPETVSAWSA